MTRDGFRSCHTGIVPFGAVSGQTEAGLPSAGKVLTITVLYPVRHT
jgi:hypothetical protein